MNATITPDGKVTVDIAALLEGMSGEALLALADTIGCTDAVIKAVADQIIDGWTDAASRAPDDSRSAEPSYALGIARRRVALAASALAKEQIKALAGKLKESEATIRRMSNAAQELRRWPVVSGEEAWTAIHVAQFNGEAPRP